MTHRNTLTPTREFHIPGERALRSIVSSFSFTEKLIFMVIAVGLSISTFLMLSDVNRAFIAPVPISGGTLTEGVIGSPRFINPLLALSDADRDLTALVYSGLMRAGNDGKLVPDLAAEYPNLSEDGLTYTFTLREDLTFHDGHTLTAQDIAFTIERAKDPLLRSPRRVNWEGVVVSVEDTRTISFTLEQPYAPFLENTTLGILPKHIWKDADSEQFPFSEYNTEPVGSGPYQISSIKKDSSGIPRTYTLSAFDDYTLGTPHISTLRISFFSNEALLAEALTDGDIDQMYNISPERAEVLSASGVPLKRITLPRVFAVFFNQNEATLLASKGVRQALDHALDKERIVDEVLVGWGTPLNGPIPPGLIDGIDQSTSTANTTSDRIAEARALLKRAGWERASEGGIYENSDGRPLAFSLSTASTPELRHAAEMVAETWNTLGADISVKIFDPSDLQQNVIRPRRFDALLFGEVIGRDMDYFAFWHSSQRNDPGLNVALYTNITVDDLLEKARGTTDSEAREEMYRAFADEVRKDTPAVFLYAPDFIYATSPMVSGITLGQLSVPSDRFANVHEWYIHTKSVWTFFK